MTICDFHSHVLPGIDDGSSSLDESIEMLRVEARQGVALVTATPHFYPSHDKIEYFLSRRERAEKLLREEMRKHEGLPILLTGAEVHYFSGMSNINALESLTIQGTRCILIEMPMGKWTDSMYGDLADIYYRLGLKPVIAHIDRYVEPFRYRDMMKKLAGLPVLIQANAGFFLDKKTGSMAMRLLEKEQIHILGSDCHNLDTRPPRLGYAFRAIQEDLGKDAIDWIVSNEKLVFTRYRKK